MVFQSFSQAAASFILVLNWQPRWLVNSPFRNPDPKLCCKWSFVPWQPAGWPWMYCLISACHPLLFGEVTNVFSHRETSAGHSNPFVVRILCFLPESPSKTLFIVGWTRTAVLLIVFEMKLASHSCNFICHQNSRLTGVSICPRHLDLFFLLITVFKLFSPPHDYGELPATFSVPSVLNYEKLISFWNLKTGKERHDHLIQLPDCSHTKYFHPETSLLSTLTCI